jgi:hypothetical protein
MPFNVGKTPLLRGCRLFCSFQSNIAKLQLVFITLYLTHVRTKLAIKFDYFLLAFKIV